MRIDGFQNIPAILQTFKEQKSTGTGTPNEATSSSSVSLSSFAEVFQALQRESAQIVKLRNEKVEQISQQVQSGKLSVNLEKLATNLVNSNVVNIKG